MMSKWFACLALLLTYGVSAAALPVPEAGGWIPLIQADSTAGWHLRHEGNNGWKVENGALANTPPSTDLLTDEVFTDFELLVEFLVPPGSNSGVYLQGRYEVQIDDAYGRDPHGGMCGAIYSKIAPKVNAARPAGEWQQFYLKFTSARRNAAGQVVRKARVTIRHNGELTIDDAEIDGVTGAAIDGREGTPGPIMLQGDHGAIQYRNVKVRPMWEGRSGWMSLFNGRDLTGWRLSGGANGWKVENGALINTPPSSNLLTEASFGDCELHVEFLVPKGSNSGVGLESRYEIQLDDCYGQDVRNNMCGAIYSKIAPRVNAARPAGEWQSFDVVFVAAQFDADGKKTANARLTVVHNGVLTIDNAEVDGGTGIAPVGPEGQPGPLFLQGDHGPVQYRNVYLRPLATE
jgi:hypothetical protein